MGEQVSAFMRWRRRKKDGDTICRVEGGNKRRERKMHDFYIYTINKEDKGVEKKNK